MTKLFEQLPEKHDGAGTLLRSGGNISQMSNSDLLRGLGNSRSMPAPVQAKMENSFGINMSDIKLFESPLVSQGGAEAVASGNGIAFAPGKLDPYSAPGQELLGHELSHVVSQKRGEVSGSGFLKDSSLEHRADNEGAMAARGESIFGEGDNK